MATAKDTPNVQFSLKKLRSEVKKVEPLQMSLSNSKVITFPDLYAEESVEAEELLGKLDRNASNWKVLDQWLSDKDAAALKAEKLSLVELVHVVRTASKYYEDAYADLGEDSASES